MKKTIDLRGLPCPEPVLRTKKLFDDQSVEAVEALVDDDVCVNNLLRLSRSIKAQAQSSRGDGYFTVEIARGAKAQSHSHAAAPQAGSFEKKERREGSKAGTIIFLSKDTFGGGDPEFSRTLLNLFLQSALEAGHEPQAILMANTGVRLMARDSAVLPVLNDFRERGCEVLACGLCVEFYGLKEDIPKEQITNMFAIVEYLFAAEKVLSP